MHEHITPVKTYLAVFATLIVLTFTTVLVSFVDVGEWNIVVALLIAFTKATLVVFIFMHVKWQNALTKLFVFAALAWLLLLMGITMSDYWSRPWLPRGGWM
jgi:cytochrome c oxidase subunit 4